MKQIKQKIEKVELIKVEIAYNPKRRTYFYNLYLQDIVEPLIIGELSEPLPDNITGMSIKYKLNEDGVITDFDLK